MGCDIHIAAQKREGEKWVRCERMIPNRYRDEGDPEFARESVYDDRNYELFAVLAGVRNWFDISPIAEPRGLPEDFAREMDDEDCHEGTWMGDHSRTWLTLAEIEAYDWQQTITLSGVVSLPERAEQLRSHLREPRGYCQGRYARDIQEVSQEELDRLIKAGETSDRYQARVCWETKPQWKCSEFFEHTLELLRYFGKPEDVRLVMGFDN